MSSRRPSWSALVVLGAALTGLFLVERSSATAGDPAVPAPSSSSTAVRAAPAPIDELPRVRQGALGATDGVVDGRLTVFDGGHPAVTRLDPELLTALRRVAAAGARRGVTLYLDSGWRSTRYQEQLLREAIARYGSAAAAARWVATPETSAHVSGDAVDVGPPAAAAWLADHGAAYGLCRVYRNEPWHFELRPDAVGRGCPDLYADAAQDPRMLTGRGAGR